MMKSFYNNNSLFFHEVFIYSSYNGHEYMFLLCINVSVHKENRGSRSDSPDLII